MAQPVTGPGTPVDRVGLPRPIDHPDQERGKQPAPEPRDPQTAARPPDRGHRRGDPVTRDESRRKLAFYFRAGVEEVLLVDLDTQGVEWLTRGADGFTPADGSALLGITTDELASAIEWPRG
jgi:hypothetical protein